MIGKSLVLKLASVAGAGFAALLVAAFFVLYEPLPAFGLGNERAEEIFQDCEECPQMLPIAPGDYVMGVPLQRRAQVMQLLGLETPPVRRVTIAEPYALGRTEVTFAQWDACVADGGCGGYSPPDEGWGRGDRPVINVSWEQAHEYVAWLSAKTGETYRLPTEAEWEYAAKAGTRTPYPWGKRPSHNRANYGMAYCHPCTGLIEGRDQFFNTAPVASFPANRWGLHDMIGNVYEWTADCATDYLPPGDYDASVVITEECARRNMRGGAWYSNPLRITSYYRSNNPPAWRDWVVGFRVVREM